MRIKYTDQYGNFTFTLAVGLNQAKLGFPELDPRDAVLIRGVRVALDAASAAPSVTGPGLTIMAFALSAREQATPANMLALEDIIFMRGLYRGSTAAIAVNILNDWSEGAPERGWGV